MDSIGVSFDVSFDPTFVYLLLVLFGAASLYQAFKAFRRYRSIRGAAATLDRERASGDATIVSGPVSVLESATPEREPPEAVSAVDHRSALFAWRIRRHSSSPGRRGSSTTETAEGGLAVGEFDVRHEGRYVRFDEDALAPESEGPNKPYDPFDDPALDLGDPTADVRLGEPDPVTKALERLRLIGDRGLFGDPELGFSVGGNSVTPDRYQAFVVGNGDELSIEGTVRETRDGPVLEPATETTPTVVASELGERGSKYRSTAIRHAVHAVVLIALGLWLPSLF
ncbi:copper transporter family protein [Natronorubrum texcoconense]|uniref:Uncharacterized protein n=1 Tax=Natronorubrum texcoconense TaxID=1095776 RepID=A0A1G8TDB5_9EURY|nr:copper transporter family protein [Natronorubrum texcoconense]SDJ39433.1 hypothetical protein SAMN04515672_0421 [Natronorubrum texcoconense]